MLAGTARAVTVRVSDHNKLARSARAVMGVWNTRAGTCE